MADNITCHPNLRDVYHYLSPDEIPYFSGVICALASGLVLLITWPTSGLSHLSPSLAAVLDVLV